MEEAESPGKDTVELEKDRYVAGLRDDRLMEGIKEKLNQSKLEKPVEEQFWSAFNDKDKQMKNYLMRDQKVKKSYQLMQ